MATISASAQPTTRAVHLVADLEAALAAGDAAPRSGVEGPPLRSEVPRELLARQSVERLLVYAVLDWLGLAAGLWAMAVGPAWLYLLGVLIVAGRLQAFGVVLHDLTHMPLRDKPWKVRLVEWLSGYPIGSTLEAMRYHHLRHHRDSGMPTDPYFWKNSRANAGVILFHFFRGGILVFFWTARGPYGVLATLFPALRNSYARVFLQDRSGADLTHDPEVIACARADIGQVICHAIVLALLLASPYSILRFVVIPQWIGGLLSGYRLMREHTGEATTDRRVGTILATTRDHGLGLGGALLFAPHNIGYHVVHHLHPHVALHHLPRLRAWYQNRTPEHYPPR